TQQEGDGAVAGVDEVAHLLHAHHEYVLGQTGAHHRIGLSDAVAVSGAGCGDVEGGGRGGADLVGDHGCQRRRLFEVCDRGDQHRAQVAARQAGLGQRLPGRAHGQVLHADVLTGAGAGDDTGALLNPLVRGVDRPHDVVVRHEVLTAHATDGGDAAAGGGGG